MNTNEFKAEVDQLLTKIKLRNQSAFAELYDKTNHRLYGLILKIIPDEELALDVLQECYHKIWLQADQFRPDLGSAWSWICQLSRNQAIDHYRKAKRNGGTKDFDSERVQEPYSADSAQVWPEHVDLSRCLRNIEKKRQSAIIGAYVYGWSHSELTEKFKVPLGTMKSWIRRGLQELRQCLEA